MLKKMNEVEYINIISFFLWCVWKLFYVVLRGSSIFFTTYFSWNSISSLFSSEVNFQESSSDSSSGRLEKVHREFEHVYTTRLYL